MGVKLEEVKMDEKKVMDKA